MEGSIIAHSTEWTIKIRFTVNIYSLYPDSYMYLIGFGTGSASDFKGCTEEL